MWTLPVVLVIGWTVFYLCGGLSLALGLISAVLILYGIYFGGTSPMHWAGAIAFTIVFGGVIAAFAAVIAAIDARHTRRQAEERQ